MKYTKISENFDIYLADGNSAISDKVIKIKGKKYYRFMTHLYVNDYVFNLPSEYVKELNKIRHKYEKLLIDAEYNDKVYLEIVNSVSSYFSKKNTNILDFGCGEGNALKTIQQFFPNSNIIGYDIRKISNPNYNTIYEVDHSSLFPNQDSYFSIIFSFFVFQFKITDTQIKELRRVLKSDGVLAFNLIKSSDFTILKKLQKFGFTILDNFKIEANHNSTDSYLFLVKKS